MRKTTYRDPDGNEIGLGGVPLERLHRGDGRIQAGTMPNGVYATVIHHGHPILGS